MAFYTIYKADFKANPNARTIAVNCVAVASAQTFPKKPCTFNEFVVHIAKNENKSAYKNPAFGDTTDPDIKEVTKLEEMSKNQGYMPYYNGAALHSNFNGRTNAIPHHLMMKAMQETVQRAQQSGVDVSKELETITDCFNKIRLHRIGVCADPPMVRKANWFLKYPDGTDAPRDGGIGRNPEYGNPNHYNPAPESRIGFLTRTAPAGVKIVERIIDAGDGKTYKDVDVEESIRTSSGMTPERITAFRLKFGTTYWSSTPILRTHFQGIAAVRNMLTLLDPTIDACD
jgi:hypothetical protein